MSPADTLARQLFRIFHGPGAEGSALEWERDPAPWLKLARWVLEREHRADLLKEANERRIARSRLAAAFGGHWYKPKP